jgi:hypothetical protein
MIYPILMRKARGKSHCSGSVTGCQARDLFIAEDCQQGYNRAVKASPELTRGLRVPPKSRQWEADVVGRLCRGGL